MKKMIILITAILTISSLCFAEQIEVVTIDVDFKWAVLKENSSGREIQVNIGDTFSGWKIVGINKDSVCVSKIKDGYILITHLSVPEEFNNSNGHIVTQ